MGLLKHLLFWPVTGPEFLVKFSLGKAEEAAKAELTDDQSVKEDLLALQMQLELGEIDDDQYVEREGMLMERLRDVRHWREQFGMGTGGGPVRVASSAPEPEEEPDREPEVASSDGASVDFNLDWSE
jgi:hypothetical protein